jgi:hypothetical protein
MGGRERGENENENENDSLEINESANSLISDPFGRALLDAGGAAERQSD